MPPLYVHHLGMLHDAHHLVPSYTGTYPVFNVQLIVNGDPVLSARFMKVNGSVHIISTHAV